MTESSDAFPGGDPDDCMAVYVSLGGSTMWRSLILLWEIVLGGDLHLGCLRESVHSYVATALMYDKERQDSGEAHMARLHLHEAVRAACLHVAAGGTNQL